MQRTPLMTATTLLLLGAMTGCSDADTTSGETFNAPQSCDENCFPLTLTTTIEKGVETEHCKFVLSPDEPIYINRDEVTFSPGSHHFLLYSTPYDTIPTENSRGESVNTSGTFPCDNGPTADWNITKLIGGSQNATGESIVTFPENVGMYIPANSVLLMNAHYINTTASAIDPVVSVNLRTIPAEQAEIEGDILFFYNNLIHVPKQGTSRARMRCPIEEEITILNVQSHMHARGVGYEAAMMTEGKMSTPFYENSRWEGVPVKEFDGGLTVPKGAKLDYFCDYKNPSNEDIVQGPRTTDEMCMLIGSYYPMREQTSQCFKDRQWIGSGEATCAETLTCIQTQLQKPGGDTQGKIASCVYASDENVADVMNEALRCYFRNTTEALTKCADEIAACSAQ